MDPAAQLARVTTRPTVGDAALVAGLLAWAVLENFTVETGDLLAGLAFSVAVTVPLLWRRHPVPVLVVVGAAVALRAVLAGPHEHGAAPFPSLLVLTFSLALHVPRLDAAALLGSVPALLMLWLSLQAYYGEVGTSLIVLFFFCGGAWASGRLVRRAAHRLESERARSRELAEAAVEAERARIARELHDVVAHAVSVVVVQAGAAEALVETRPDLARKHLAEVRRVGREALVEMRHLLSVLREDGATYVPQPTVASLHALAEELSASGTEVEVSVEDLGEDLPAGVELCVYRVVQEALTNVRKHAPDARTSVSVVRQDDRLVVEVVDSGGVRGAALELDGPGHGLVGMRERIRVYGGELDVGPRGEGFAVRATVPLDPVGATR